MSLGPFRRFLAMLATCTARDPRLCLGSRSRQPAKQLQDGALRCGVNVIRFQSLATAVALPCNGLIRLMWLVRELWRACGSARMSSGEVLLRLPPSHDLVLGIQLLQSAPSLRGPTHRISTSPLVCDRSLLRRASGVGAPRCAQEAKFLSFPRYPAKRSAREARAQHTVLDRGDSAREARAQRTILDRGDVHLRLGSDCFHHRRVLLFFGMVWPYLATRAMCQ